MKPKRALFGVAGNPPNFWRSKYSNDRGNAIEWLHSIGLDALEIQCTYGVRTPAERISIFKALSKKFEITLSIHGPYYINLGCSHKSKIDNTINELKKTVDLAKAINSSRVIFHLGGVELERKASVAQAIKTLKLFEKMVDLDCIKLFPEIDGTISRLGSLEEVLEICGAVESAWPCLDLAHHHARSGGALRTKEDVSAIIDKVVGSLGNEALKHLHFHYYPIKWSSTGEKCHKAFDDTVEEEGQRNLFDDENERDGVYYPRYEPFIEVIVENKLKPIIICEAKDSQDVGALKMKQYYLAIK